MAGKSDYVPHFVDGISLKPHCAIGYTIQINQRYRSLMPKSNKSIGYLSMKAKAKMNNAINWLIYLSEGKKYYSKKTKKTHKLHVNFMTLTLSAKQMHDDKYIVNKMLRPFLKYLVRQGIELYVWRAEAQFNGNIHFHITTNKYIHYQSIRNKWNSIQQKHGYIKEYIANGGDENPNSTDIHGVKSIDNLASYMVKYMGKAQVDNYCSIYLPIESKPKQNFIIGELELNKKGFYQSKRRVLTCKVWSCSTQLMNKRKNIDEGSLLYNELKQTLELHSEQKQKDKHVLFLYDSVATRNYLFKLQLYAEAYNQLFLHDEKINRERLSSELGRDKQKDKIERQLYMPTLWEQTE